MAFYFYTTVPVYSGLWMYLWQIQGAEQLIQRQHTLLLQQFNLLPMALRVIALLLFLNLYCLLIVLLLTWRLKVSVCIKKTYSFVLKNFNCSDTNRKLKHFFESQTQMHFLSRISIDWVHNVPHKSSTRFKVSRKTSRNH